MDELPDRQESWPQVTVVGPGGVGAFYGGMLARAGAPVTTSILL